MSGSEDLRAPAPCKNCGARWRGRGIAWTWRYRGRRGDRERPSRVAVFEADRRFSRPRGPWTSIVECERTAVTGIASAYLRDTMESAEDESKAGTAHRCV